MFIAGDFVKLNGHFMGIHGYYQKGSIGKVMTYDLPSNIAVVEMSSNGELETIEAVCIDLVAASKSVIFTAQGGGGGGSGRMSAELVEHTLTITCHHKWAPYKGLTKQYEFCTACDAKRNEKGIYD